MTCFAGIHCCHQACFISLSSTACATAFVLPNHHSVTRLSCAVQQAFEPVVVAQKGFKWINEKPEMKDPTLHKWGYISEQVGAWAEVCCLCIRWAHSGQGMVVVCNSATTVNSMQHAALPLVGVGAGQPFSILLQGPAIYNAHVCQCGVCACQSLVTPCI